MRLREGRKREPWSTLLTYLATDPKKPQHPAEPCQAEMDVAQIHVDELHFNRPVISLPSTDLCAIFSIFAYFYYKAGSMKKIYAALALAGALSASSVALAEGAVYAGFGTLGLNAGYKHAVSNDFGIRAGFNTFNFNRTYSDDDAEYEGKLKFSSFELLGDWHPMNNGFAVTAGILANGNKFEGDVRLNENRTITIDGIEYAGSNPSANATVKFGSISPYLGVGYTANPATIKGLQLNVGLGVLFQSPKVSIRADGVNDPTGTLDTSIRNAEKELKSDVNSLKNYPVLSLGLSYAF